MRRTGSIFLILLMLAVGRAEAVTAKDILDLHRAGLTEPVLLALIEVDGGVFTIDTETLTALKAAGVSEKVIEAMVRSGRTKPEELVAASPLPPPPPPEPQVIVVEHERPVVEQVVVPVPVYVAVPTGRARGRGHHKDVKIVDPAAIPFGIGNSVPGFGAIREHVSPRKREPVYWGWGGKLRPDAWKPRQ